MSASRERLDEFVERMRSAAGENLLSVILYGSASRQDFNEAYSDLNLLCGLRDADPAELARIAPVVHWWSKELRQRPPLVMSVEEFRSSADVFAIEVLDMQADHRVLHGTDIVAGLEVSMTSHRVELERELRTTSLKLRQHFIFACDDEEELKRVLIRSASTTLTLLRHALITLGEPRAGTNAAVLQRVAEIMRVDVSPFEAALALREHRSVQVGYRQIFEEYVRLLAAVVSAVDNAGPQRST